MPLLNQRRAFFMLIDVQERFVPHIHQCDQVVKYCRQMLTVASQISLPVIVSEQYPKGLGQTVDELIASWPPDTAVYAKMHFSCLKDSALRDTLLQQKEKGRAHAILMGVETHVCVLQTAMDLLEEGFVVYVVADAVSSRTAENRELALTRLRQAGAEIVSTEMVLTELVEEAGTPDFKALMGLMRE